MNLAHILLRITEAAKKMRIKTHPDRLKKAHMSPEEKAKIDETAGTVGQAAEVLSDPEKVIPQDHSKKKLILT